MRKLVTLFLIVFAAAAVVAKTDDALRQLDEVLGQRTAFMEQKQLRIDSIRSSMERTSTTAEKLQVLNSLFDEYHTFRFDSTLAVADRAEKLALASGDSLALARVKIHKALSSTIQSPYSARKMLTQTIAAIRISTFNIPPVNPEVSLNRSKHFSITRQIHIVIIAFWLEKSHIFPRIARSYGISLTKAVIIIVIRYFL